MSDDDPVTARDIVSTVRVFVDGWQHTVMCNGRPIASWRQSALVPGSDLYGEECAEECARMLRLALLSPLAASATKEKP